MAYVRNIDTFMAYQFDGSEECYEAICAKFDFMHEDESNSFSNNSTWHVTPIYSPIPSSHLGKIHLSKDEGKSVSNVAFPTDWIIKLGIGKFVTVAAADFLYDYEIVDDEDSKPSKGEIYATCEKT
jgi:hypothetical protein